MFETSLDLENLAAPELKKSVKHPTAKARRDAIKAAGGAEYEALLETERAARKRYRATHPEKYKTYRQKHRRDVLKNLCKNARIRGRERGLEATIRVADLEWPKRCPVLGIELDYTPRGEGRTSNNPANPTLDRLDNTKGYVPGNVFVISMRANTIKNNATWQELHAVMTYARAGVEAVRLGRFPSSLRRYAKK
jgi:hypothetical protein